MARARRGPGSVFQRTCADSKGKLRKTNNWYVEFVSGNRTIREATEFAKWSDAVEFLKKRISEARVGKVVRECPVLIEAGACSSAAGRWTHV
jgi:hypothetical protein